MNVVPLRFVHIGFGNVVCANRVMMLLNPQTANARRLLKSAKEATPPSYIDISSGRSTKCLLVLDDNTLIGCSLSYKTLMARLNTEATDTDDD